MHLNYRSYYISSGKSCGDINDLLQLKIFNSNTHTSISHFMEIQQKEKESLTANIYHFKREAKRCNFMNNAATIRIVVKGLKDTHNLAMPAFMRRDHKP